MGVRHAKSCALTGFALAMLLASDPGSAGTLQVQYAQLTIRQSVVLRVPTRPAVVRSRMRWKEKKGPRCIPMAKVAGAAVSARNSVDIILRGASGRVRAEFGSSCPALDFYSGFYILPTEDRMICADRDSIHARSGGECQVTRFRGLVAEPVDAQPPKRSLLDRIRGRD